MLRIVSANLNGIRSAHDKGFFTWLDETSPDIVCVQELKAQEGDLREAMRQPPGYHAHFHDAEKKGYSGVGISSRRAPDRHQFDECRRSTYSMLGDRNLDYGGGSAWEPRVADPRGRSFNLLLEYSLW